MNILLEALLQQLFEGYKEAQTEFAAASDSATATQTIAAYKELVNRNQVQGDERNIDWWRKQGWEAFQQFVNVKNQSKSVTQIKRSNNIGKSIILREDSQWLIVIPIDKDASCYHGKHTDWCTTKAATNHFEEYFYTKEITLVYFLKIDTGEKWAIACSPDVDEIECFDSADQPLSEAVFKRQTGHDARQYKTLALQHTPALNQQRTKYSDIHTKLSKQLPFTTKSEEIKQGLIFTKDYMLMINYLTATGRDNQLEKLVFASAPVESVNYLRAIGVSEPNVFLERSLLRTLNQQPPTYVSIQACCLYARDLRHSRWAEFEPILLSSSYNNLVMMYKEQVVQGEWLSGDNPTTNQDPKLIVSHAIDIGKRASPEQEQRILTDFSSAFEYATLLLSERWPELEEKLLKSGDAQKVYTYITSVINNRWLEAESIILTDPEISVRYATIFMPNGWPEAEAIIASDSDAIIRYCKSVISGRWEYGEQALIKAGNTKDMLNYNIAIMAGEPWLEAEPTIATWEVDDQIKYAEHVYKYQRRGWPQLEQLVIKTPQLICDYVKAVTKSRLESGEQLLNDHGTAKQGWSYSVETELNWQAEGYQEMHDRIEQSPYHDRYLDALDTMY